jgi:hypothetical protein
LKSPQQIHPEQIQAPIGSALSKDLASVLDSVWMVFEEDACATMDGVLDVHDRLQECIEHGAAEGGDPNLAFESAHRIITEARHKWIWDLQKVAADYVIKLATIALARPESVTENPASWARGRTKELVGRWLDGRLAPRIVSWFQRACDGLPDFDRHESESGRPEPWCIPAWAARGQDWPNDPARLDERLTPELTQEFLLTRRQEFESGLEPALKVAENTARVSLAMQPAPLQQERLSRIDLKPTAPVPTPDLGIAKMKDPDKYPLMTLEEVKAALGLRKSAVYDHPDIQRVSNRARAARFTTKSVLAILNSAPK